ncbi:MAG: metallophosphoesterase [Candidatus Micrarchaeota archaeon]|nr:metallophosphoesterase [Candidatus Micrarchaeota archaeon]
MRILALSDLHSEGTVLEGLKNLLDKERFDLVIIAGDITQRGPLSYAEGLLDVLRGEKVLAIHGNMDTQQVIDLLERNGFFFHLSKVEVGEWNFVGFGGSSPTPFGTLIEYDERQIYDELSRFRMNSKTILVTHSPPYDSGVDKTSAGVIAGSKSIRRIIEEKKPFMDICGHIHEASGEVMIGNTKVVKVPPAMEGKAVEIELGNTVATRIIKLATSY